MITEVKQSRRGLAPLFGVASVALLGLSLAACSPVALENAGAGNTSETTPPASSATVAAATEPSAPAHIDGGSTVTVKVNGTKGSALVKSLVVTDDGKETGAEMTQQTLPYTQTLSIPARQTFTKVFVLAKYPSGATDDISCSVSVDGKEVAANSSNNHRPVECLFVENSSK
ncbi:MAG: hypothetical protein ABI563_17595 [Specibacter sp.]